MSISVLAVDLSSVARWAWSMHADGRMTEGEAFGLVLAKVAKASDGFDRIAICRDWGRTGSSFRRLACPGYKGGRTKPPEPYYAMVKALLERFAADGATIYPTSLAEAHPSPAWTLEANGETYKLFAEADDVIASLAAWYAASHRPENRLRILSGDTDLWALVDDEHQIDVFTLDDKLIREPAVIERFGVGAHLVPDVKALAGDDGDDYKPYPHHDPAKKGGIGIDKAAKLLKDWRSFGGEELGLRPAQSVLYAAQEGAKYEADNPGKGPPPGSMADCHERRCLLAGGAAALTMGYACADMLRDLPIDFNRILLDPVVKPLTREEPAKPEEVAAKPGGSMAMVAAPREALVLGTAPEFNRMGLQPTSLFDGENTLIGLAKMLFNSRLYPQLGTFEAVASVIFEARERGIPAATALRSTYVVKGRVAWSAASLAGMVLASPRCRRFRIIETDFTKATIEYQRDDEERPSRFTFTLEEAKGAGWLKSGEKGDSKWITNPRTMLRWAAIREAARAFFPDVVSGIYTAEELRGECSDDELRREERDLGDVMP